MNFFRRSRTRILLAMIGTGFLAAGSAAIAHPGASPSRPAAPSPEATAALTRLIHNETLAPALSALGSRTRVGALTQEQTYNWSGYADDNSTGKLYSKVSASWTQPKVSCPPKEDELVVWWVGLDGLSNATVEQDGTFAYCHEGGASYYSWWEMYPTNDIQIVGSTVAPGDQITSSVSFASPSFTLAVADATSPANSFSKKSTCGTGETCSRTSAEWIVETPGTDRDLAPWPNFGSWKVNSAKVTGGGVSGVISSFPDDKITIVVGPDNPQTLANTGGLNATGNGFSDTWQYAW